VVVSCGIMLEDLTTLKSTHAHPSLQEQNLQGLVERLELELAEQHRINDSLAEQCEVQFALHQTSLR
jgi:hypothetical protein